MITNTTTTNNTILFNHSLFLKSLIFLSLIFVFSANGQVNAPYFQERDPVITGGSTSSASTASMSADGQTSIVVADTAVYCYSSNNNFPREIKIFGKAHSASISSDGNTAIIGNFKDQGILGASYGIGAAWILKRTNQTWSIENKLVGTGAVGYAGQGVSVGISADGNTAVVGGNNDSSGVGAAWVFVKANGVWKQQGNKLVGIETIGKSWIGNLVAISADGNTIALGGSRDNDFKGAIWVFMRSNDQWLQKKIVTDASIPRSGQFLSLSGNGNILAIRSDKIYLFERMGYNWILSNKLSIGGSCLSLSYQGDIIAIGGSKSTTTDRSETSISFYELHDQVWTLIGDDLIATGGTPSRYGSTADYVSISAYAESIILGSISPENTWIFHKFPAFFISSNTQEAISGHTLKYDLNIENLSPITSPLYNMEYFLSKDSIHSEKDIFLRAYKIPNITGKAKSISIVDLNIPDIAIGKYFINIVAVFGHNKVIPAFDGIEKSMSLLIGKTPITIGKPDLSIKSKSLSTGTTIAGGTIEINSSITNTGNVSTSNNAVVEYYLSNNGIFDSADVRIASAPIASMLPNASLTLPVQTYTVPTGLAKGKYSIIIFADKNRSIIESNEVNNVDSVSLTITTPNVTDLSIHTTKATPRAVLAGDNVLLECSVINTGTVGSETSSLGYYISATDAIYDPTDPAVVEPLSIKAIAPQEIVDAAQVTYTIPEDAKPGTYTVFFVADNVKVITESNEQNNVGSVSFSVGAFSDLYSASLVPSTSSILPGEPVSVSGTVINLGSTPVDAYNVQYFLSSDAKYQSTDIPLSAAIPQSTLVSSGVNELSKTTYTIPAGITPGNYFLLLVADLEGTVKELNKANNVISTPLTIIGLPDFVISSPVVSPLSVFSGDSISISYNLENKGGNSKNPNVDLQYFLSTNDKYEVGDTPLSSSVILKSPASLSSVSIAALKFPIPANTPTGAYYVIIVADLKYGENELSEVNNSTSVAVTVAALPDLSIASAVVTGAIVLPGDSIRIAATLVNSGSASGASVSLAYYFSLDTKIDTSDKVVANLTVPALAGLASFKIPIVSYKVPFLTAPSNYYILIAADSKNTIRESSETNNLGQATVAVSSTSLADYSIDAPSLSAFSSIAGDTIMLGSTVKNIGKNKASKESFVQYFLSSDKVWDKGDVALGEPILVPMLEVDGSQLVPSKKCIVPSSTKAGGYYVLYFADKDNVLFEANEANNVAALQLKVSERADLTITSENVSPLALFESDSVSIACTVENIGNGKTPVSVNLQYYLSSDKLFDKEDKMLGNGISIPTLAGGDKFDVALNKIKIPLAAPGNYFVLLVVDNTNDLVETSELNNIVAVAVTLQAFVDLSIQNAFANPKNVFPGDAVTFSATIQNVGKGNFVNPFRIQFFLSKNKTYELSDTSISEPIAVLALPKTVPFNYTIKATQPTGTYFVLVLVDAGNQVRESDESNNIYAIPLPIGNVGLMDIEVGDAVPTNNYPLAGDTIEIAVDFKNAGTEPTRESHMQFFLSTDNEMSNGDIALTNTSLLPLLAIKEKREFKVKLPIPLTVKPGPYYILSFGDVANTLNESNEENNIEATKIGIIPFPDLQVSRVKASRETMFIGDTTTLSSTVVNASGSKTRNAVSFQYFLSLDRQFSNDDRPLGNKFVIDVLDTLKEFTIPATRLSIPSDLIGGFYYLLPVADSEKKLRESNEGNNTLPLRLTINPRPVIVSPDTLSLTPGSKDVITINIKVKSELPVAKVNFTYRKLTNFKDTVSINLPVKGLSYTGNIPTAFLDEIGAEYAFYAIDSSGNRSLLSQGSVPVEWKSPGLTIPYRSYGTQTSNYRMIAVPLNLKVNRIDSMMYESQGIYNKKKWRMFTYSNGSTIEFTFGAEKNIDAGKAYWFVAKDSLGPIFTGPGSTVTASIENPFSIPLVQGWNLIGNPYNMTIYWSDVLNYKKNNKKLLDAFYTYNGTYQSDQQKDQLASMEGAFVYATENTRLYFPTHKRTQISKSIRKGISMDELNWSLDFKLSDEKQTSNISGLGMNTIASASKDELDALTPPRFLNYLELNFAHPEYVYSKFTKDIVPTADSYVWDFTIESEVAGKKSLSWNNSYFKNNAKMLLLYDKEDERVINMGIDSSYNFESGSVKHLSVYYGNLEFIENNLQPERITLGNPYPNPLSEKTNFTVSLPAGLDSYALKLSVYNAFGQEVHTIANAQFTPGFYNFNWDGLDEQGNKQASGIYLIKLKVDAAGLQREMSRKVMVRD